MFSYPKLALLPYPLTDANLPLSLPFEDGELPPPAVLGAGLLPLPSQQPATPYPTVNVLVPPEQSLNPHPGPRVTSAFLSGIRHEPFPTSLLKSPNF